MMNCAFCTEDFKLQPFWWDHTPRPEIGAVALPDDTEVLVVGSGYTGLHCALQTASAGRATTVVDAEAAGWGCSKFEKMGCESAVIVWRPSIGV